MLVAASYLTGVPWTAAGAGFAEAAASGERAGDGAGAAGVGAFRPGSMDGRTRGFDGAGASDAPAVRVLAAVSVVFAGVSAGSAPEATVPVLSGVGAAVAANEVVSAGVRSLLPEHAGAKVNRRPATR